MELKLIGAGFGRTGTWSTKAALDQLGFPCYHMSEILGNKENKSHLNFWRKVANSPYPISSQQDWSQVFAKYQATVDNPGCCVWRELLAAYPEAKVLLTLHPRGAEAWYTTARWTHDLWQREHVAVQGAGMVDAVRAGIRRYGTHTVDLAKVLARDDGRQDEGDRPLQFLCRRGQSWGSGRQTVGLQGRPGLGAAMRVSRRSAA